MKNLIKNTICLIFSVCCTQLASAQTIPNEFTAFCVPKVDKKDLVKSIISSATVQVSEILGIKTKDLTTQVTLSPGLEPNTFPRDTYFSSNSAVHMLRADIAFSDSKSTQLSIAGITFDVPECETKIKATIKMRNNKDKITYSTLNTEFAVFGIFKSNKHW